MQLALLHTVSNCRHMQCAQRRQLYLTDVGPTCMPAGVPLGPQISKLNRGCDVVVGTPGRIIDLIENSGALKLSQVRRLSSAYSHMRGVVQLLIQCSALRCGMCGAGFGQSICSDCCPSRNHRHTLWQCLLCMPHCL